MATIRVDTNARDVSRWIREIRRDQAPFALSLSINNTAKQAQVAQREHQHDVFTVRRKTFMDRAVKIKPFAKKADPFAIIRIDPPGGQKRADIITRHEEDRTRTPEEGRSLIVPREQGAARVIRRKGNPLHPSKWKMKRVDSGSGRFQVYRGARGLYMIRAPDGSGVVKQRTGTGKHGTHEGAITLFTLHPRTPLDPKLDFVENVTRIVDERWEENIAAAWDKALATAK